MIAEAGIRNAVDIDGFEVVEGVLSRQEVDDLLLALEKIDDTGSLRKRSGIFAVRNLLEESPEVSELAGSHAVRCLVEPVLGTPFFPVRGILFDKIPDANWKVPWHQDVTIAVRERVETDGFGPWSMKADVLHVQPPASILESMLTVLYISTTAAKRTEPYAFYLVRIRKARFLKTRFIRCGSTLPSISAPSG